MEKPTKSKISVPVHLNELKTEDSEHLKNRSVQLEMNDALDENDTFHSSIQNLDNSDRKDEEIVESLINIEEIGSLELLPDPLHLIDLKKTTEEINGTTKKVQKFYQAQNELIDLLLAPVIPKTEHQRNKENFQVNLAIYGAGIGSIFLICLELTAAILSGSLSIFATMADGFMDLLSSLILLTTKYFSKKTEIYRYPSGKGRFETVGVVVFGSLMTTLSLQLIIHSIKTLIDSPKAPQIDIITIILMLIVFLTKFCLYFQARLIDNIICKALANDHRNDLFLNLFGITLAFLGKNIYPLIDPIGAIIISLIIFSSWSTNVLKHCRLIVGKCASSDFIKRITYIAMIHDEMIVEVDTCKAYHAGTKIIVEVDIVLPPNTTLQIAHDLGESLQNRLELLPDVERAYVHVDYESTHTPEHQKEFLKK